MVVIACSSTVVVAARISPATGDSTAVNGANVVLMATNLCHRLCCSSDRWAKEVEGHELPPVRADADLGRQRRRAVKAD
jgi:hypothetical protein